MIIGNLNVKARSDMFGIVGNYQEISRGAVFYRNLLISKITQKFCQKENLVKK